jgi:ribosomal protein S6
MAKEKTSPEMAEINEMEAADSAEVRVYELGFHIDAELPQEEVKNTYQAIRAGIAALGTVVAEGEPTKVPLAYTISIQNTTGRRDFDTAFFCWIAYEANGAGHAAVSELAGANKSIIRFIDLRTTTEGAKHSAEMHEIFAQAALLEAEGREKDMEDDSSSPEEVAPVREEEAVV